MILPVIVQTEEVTMRSSKSKRRNNDIFCSLFEWEEWDDDDIRSSKGRFELELKLIPAIRQLGGLENVGPQNCLTFSCDGSFLATGGEVNLPCASLKTILSMWLSAVSRPSDRAGLWPNKSKPRCTVREAAYCILALSYREEIGSRILIATPYFCLEILMEDYMT